jgi:hypothetical protein
LSGGGWLSARRLSSFSRKLRGRGTIRATAAPLVGGLSGLDEAAIVSVEVRLPKEPSRRPRSTREIHGSRWFLMPIERRIASLLRKLAALEETIARLEKQGEDSRETVRRLRFLQGELLTALALLDRDARPPDFFASD